MRTECALRALTLARDAGMFAVDVEVGVLGRGWVALGGACGGLSRRADRAARLTRLRRDSTVADSYVG
jgi:hypothetical protein